jgi:hypothetical protein
VRAITTLRSLGWKSATSARNKPGEERSPTANAKSVRRIAMDLLNEATMKVKLYAASRTADWAGCDRESLSNRGPGK